MRISKVRKPDPRPIQTKLCENEVNRIASAYKLDSQTHEKAIRIYRTEVKKLSTQIIELEDRVLQIASLSVIRAIRDPLDTHP